MMTESKYRAPDRWDQVYRFGNYLLALFLSLTHLPMLSDPFVGGNVRNTLDPSWIVITYLALLNHVKFGASYIWTYGPLGFLDFILTINPRLASVADLIQIALAFLLPVLIVYVLTSRLRLPPSSVSLAILIVLLPPYHLIGGAEWIAPVCGLMLLYITSLCLLRSPMESRVDIAYLAAFIVAGALLAVGPLVKASLLPAVLGIVSMWSVDICLRGRWRALSLVVVPFLVVWFGVFILVGSGIGSGIFWPIAEIPIIAGYSSAMALPGSGWHLALAAILSGLALISGIIALWLHHDQWWFIGSMTLLWLTAFKEGFVRAGGRVFVGFFSLAPLFVLLLWWPSQSTETAGGSEPFMWVSRGATASTVVACTLCLLIFGQFLPITLPSLSERTASVSPKRYLGQSLPIALPSISGTVAKLDESIRLIDSARRIRKSLAQEKAGVAERPGLAALVPLLRGRAAFAWPWDGNAIVAAGAHQDFPPIPQQYSAYTESLDRIDAGFFASPARPQLGLVSVAAIDGRLPLQTAGLSFVRLLTCYRPAVLSGRFLLVESRPPAFSACSANPTLSSSMPWRQGSLKQWLRVPSRPGHITMIQIRIRMSALGLLMKWLLKPAPLALNMHMSHGETSSFRVVHATLPDGILVSTVLLSVAQLAQLWRGAPNNNVTTVALRTPQPSQWASSFSYRFVQLPTALTPAPAPMAGRGQFNNPAPLRTFNVIPTPAVLRSLLAHDNRASLAWTLLSTIYAERADLQQAFPENSSDFPRTLLRWALTSGVTIDYEAALLRPYQTTFSIMLKRLATATPKDLRKQSPKAAF